ncbi:divergent polysaccharide deacetylase family protein [Pseudoalteromonas sp. K222D]|uniref:divergent polysaccharide deacetylase family protein n=1 Tax=Pseudoalteromonas TaxID=53246 RepID=UPI0015C83898|nr:MULTISPECIES: divergent polysaccharide deacetylase family protein [unclassified Pseudoalteromonas]MBH0093470.1 divergent polysaccharide deacetylase family protein [Pseudoalteromonas sp. SCQQ13]MBO7926521.1 divergent polysaccharide deacetylase family protein [Pseudoalteromonas sp. K222D]NYR12015.1 divergent polysaccharide deacetylase family protein [Pseudoalteromonas sp. MIP2626]
MKVIIGLILMLGFASLNAKAKQIAIVIDDIGYHQRDLELLTLPGQVSYSILPHTPYAQAFATLASKTNKELLLHIPMQALNGKELGPGALTLNMNKEQIQQILGTALASLPQVKGVNNHMGSALTQQGQAMRWIMEVLKKRHLYFLDSRTTELSQAQNAANFLGVENIGRHIFLDNITTPEQLQLRLDELKQHATEHKFAIAIAHPYPETIAFLRHVLPQLSKQGFELVPVSKLVERKYIQLAEKY